MKNVRIGMKSRKEVLEIECENVKCKIDTFGNLDNIEVFNVTGRTHVQYVDMRDVSYVLYEDIEDEKKE